MSVSLSENIYMGTATPASGGGTVDQTYDPTSANAQSGVAVKEAVDGVLPSQAGNSGKFLTTDGTDASWETITIPSVDIDGVTVTKNASDELQASAVMNARTGTDALPIWQGTEQQWTNGVPTTWYNWRTDVSASEISGSLTNRDWECIAFGDGRFVIVGFNSGYAAYSTDGENWSFATTPPYSRPYRFMAYGNNTFVAVASNTTSYTYSTDGGITWSTGSVNISGFSDLRGGLAFGNGIFVVCDYTGDTAYSSDGITWTKGGKAGSGSYSRNICFGNNEFMIVSAGVAYTSTDAITWTQKGSTSTQQVLSLVYGNGTYIVTDRDRTKAIRYSTDGGSTWYLANTPDVSSYSYAWQAATFGNGKFVAYCFSTDLGAYSVDGINWTGFTLQKTGWWYAAAYGNGKYVSVALDINYTSITTLSQGSVYTFSETPETTDTVYSTPNTASALTITSVGTGTITLSDSNTYTYTQSGDEVTYQSIGEAHPTWLCNINGVGVKVGTTVVADNTDTSTLQTKANLVTSVDSSSTDSQYPSAKLFYDTVGDIETALHNINSGS